MHEPDVRIGEAAALYGLAPSTLRWWETQGVIHPPARDGPRRRYRADDLRRIGLAYLCCVTGMMPLDQAAVVTSRTSNHQAWQAAVETQIAHLDRLIDQLGTARHYLSHLLWCPEDDLAACPDLDDELHARTPRGRIDKPDLIAAARTAYARAKRDEKHSNISLRDEIAAATNHRCPSCDEPVLQPTRGRPRTYCSHSCQQRAYRARRQDRQDR
jgi:MerR family copper efflux transcriptional regulator